MNHGRHGYLMTGLVAVAAVLFLTGTAGGLVFLLWPVACTAMMIWMMWGMGRSAPAPAEHTHDDGRTHAHA